MAFFFSLTVSPCKDPIQITFCVFQEACPVLQLALNSSHGASHVIALIDARNVHNSTRETANTSQLYVSSQMLAGRVLKYPVIPLSGG